MAFESALAKIERAENHIDDLHEAFQAFLKGHPHTINDGVDQSGRLTLSVSFGGPLPVEFALIVGDAAHNLKTALDHATWELVGLDGGPQDRWLQFPFGDTQSNYESLCGGLKTPRADTNAFFVGLGAYQDGPGKQLYTLNRLDIIDKHKILTPLVAACEFHGGIEIVDESGKVVIQLAKDGVVTMHVAPDGTSVSGISVPQGMQIRRDTSSEPVVDIFFDKVDPIGVRRMIPALTELRDATAATIANFKAFVNSRP